MPLLVAVGHVTRDVLAQGERTGGAVSYASLCARRLGWEAAVVSRAAGSFDAARELPGVRAEIAPSRETTRFVNAYVEGRRRQHVEALADPIDGSEVPDDLRRPEALLLCPVAGEIRTPLAGLFEAGVVAAVAQGWLREIGPDGRVAPRPWVGAEGDLAGVDVVFVSPDDLPGGAAAARALLAHVPRVVLTRGRAGVELLEPDRTTPVPALPAAEVDPTGAGDVFAAAFVVRYHECLDPVEAAAFAASTAAFAVEGVGASALASREAVTRRLERWRAGSSL